MKVLQKPSNEFDRGKLVVWFGKIKSNLLLYNEMQVILLSHRIAYDRFCMTWTRIFEVFLNWVTYQTDGDWKHLNRLNTLCCYSELAITGIRTLLSNESIQADLICYENHNKRSS